MPGLIVSTAEASTNVPGFASLPSQQQADLAAAATSAINGWCGRVLALTTHDEIYSPENTKSVRLKQYPVVDVYRLATGLSTVVTIQCTLSNASRATVKLTATGQGDSLAVTGVSLTSIAGGIAASTPFLFASYPTVGSLAAAINALGGWSASIPPKPTYPNVDPASWATADINADLGARGAIGSGVALWGFLRDLNVYDVDYATGKVTIHEDLYQPFQFPGRMYAAAGQYGAVRAIYAAGFNDDPNAGAVTMPDDLKRAAFILIQAMVQKSATGAKSSEHNSLQGYQLIAGGSIGLVTDMISRHRKRRFV